MHSHLGRTIAVLLLHFASAAAGQPLPAPAAAASAPAPAASAPASAASAPAAQTITVTGVRRSAIDRANRSASGLLDVPENEKPRAIDIIDGQVLRNQIAAGEDDVIGLIPGAQNNSFGRGQGIRITLRGLNAGIALDGVSTGDNAVNIQPELIEQVEVQRGVNGLETSAIGFGFGGGAGGTINLLRKYPTAERFTEVFANGDQWGRWRVGVDANIPLGPQRQGLRVIAAHGKDDTYFRGEPATDYRLFSVAGTWAPAPSLILDGAVDVVRESAQLSYYLSDVNGDYSRLPRIDPRQSYGAPWSRSEGKTERVTFKGTYLFNDDWALEASLRRDRNDNRRTDFYYFFGADLATGAADTVAFLSDGGVVRVGVSDLAVKGSFTTGPIKHLLTFGASRYDWTSDNAGRVGGYFGPVNVNNIYAWVAPPRPDPASLGEPSSPERIGRNDTSVMFQWRATFAERYDLWLGARRSRYATDVSGGTVSSETAVDRFTTPIVSLAWRPNSAHTLYATSAESITPGRVVSDFYENRGEVIPPLKVRQWEVGWKWRSPSHALTLAAFSTEDPRIVEVALDDSGERLEERADGLNRFRGMELAGQWRRGAWQLNGGVVLLDAVVKESASDPALVGTRASGVARRSAYVGAEYTPPWWPGLELGARWRVLSSALLDGGAYSTPGYALLDANAAWTFGPEQRATTLRVAVSNLFNRYHVVNYDSGFSFFPGAPRTLRFEWSQKL